MVCDSGVLQRLHRGKALDCLKALYEKVVVPQQVADEIERGRTDGVDLPDISALDWIEVRAPRDPDMVSVASGLGPSERASVSLTMDIPGAVLVTDEALAREQAKMLRLKSTGTIGVLLRAKQRNVIPRLAPVLDLLNSRGFRILPSSRSAILAWAGETP
jgi:predicted nucleic acid-binding protein